MNVNCSLIKGMWYVALKCPFVYVVLILKRKAHGWGGKILQTYLNKKRDSTKGTKSRKNWISYTRNLYKLYWCTEIMEENQKLMNFLLVGCLSYEKDNYSLRFSLNTHFSSTTNFLCKLRDGFYFKIYLFILFVKKFSWFHLNIYFILISKQKHEYWVTFEAL